MDLVNRTQAGLRLGSVEGAAITLELLIHAALRTARSTRHEDHILNDGVLSVAKTSALAFLPGVATPGEIMRGLDARLTHFKLFPAGAIGRHQIAQGVFWSVRTGALLPYSWATPENATSHLAPSNVVCIGVAGAEESRRNAQQVSSRRTRVYSFSSPGTGIVRKRERLGGEQGL